MKTIICGGRKYRLTREDIATLDRYREKLPITELVCGMAPGVDSMSRDWALQRGLTVQPFPADWSKHGNAAGPIRNQAMADYAEACIAFPGGSGTADMFRRARLKGLRMVMVDNRETPATSAALVQPLPLDGRQRLGELGLKMRAK